MSLRVHLYGCVLASFAGGFASAGSIDIHAPDIVPVVEQKPAPKGKSVALVREGKPCFAIVADLAAERRLTTARRRPSVRPAVELLVGQFERATGVKPPVFESADEAKYGTYESLLVVGDNALARSAGVDWEKLPKQGFVVTTFAKGVVICGHDTIRVPGYNEKPTDRFGTGTGTLFGAYDFCERFLGARWYFPGKLGTLQPKIDALTVDPVRYADSPWFDTRGNSYGCYLSGSTPERMARINRLLGEELEFKRDIQGYYRHGRPGRTLPYRGEHAPNPLTLYKAFPDKRETIFFRDPSGHLHGSADNIYGCYFNVFDLGFADFLVDIWKRYLESDCTDDPAELHQYVGTGYCDFGVCDTVLEAKDYLPVEVVKRERLVTDEDFRRAAETDDDRAATANIYGRFYKYLCERMQKELPGTKLNIIAYYNSKWAPTRYRLPDNFEASVCDGRLLSWITDPVQQEASRRLFGEWCAACGGRSVDQAYVYSDPDVFAASVTPQYVGDIPKVLGKSLSRGGIFFDHGADWRHFYAYYIALRAEWNPSFDRAACRAAICARLFGEAGGDRVAKFLTGVDRVVRTYHMKRSRVPYPPKAIEALEALFARAEAAVPKGGDEERRFALLKDYWPGAFKKARETYAKTSSGAFADAAWSDSAPSAAALKALPKNAYLPFRCAWNATGLWGAFEGASAELALSPDPKREVEYRFRFAADGSWTSEKQQVRPIPQPADKDWKPSGVTNAKGVFCVPFAALGLKPPKVYEWWEANGTHIRFAGRGDGAWKPVSRTCPPAADVHLKEKVGAKSVSLTLSNPLATYSLGILRLDGRGNVPWMNRSSLSGGIDSKCGFGVWSDLLTLTVNGVSSNALLPGEPIRWSDGKAAGYDIPLNFNGVRYFLRVYLRPDSKWLQGELRLDPSSPEKPRQLSLSVQAIPSFIETKPKPRYTGYARTLTDLGDGALLIGDRDYDGSGEGKGCGPCAFRIDPKAVRKLAKKAGDGSNVQLDYELDPAQTVIRFAWWDDREHRHTAEDVK